jgi:hypothetical protein
MKQCDDVEVTEKMVLQKVTSNFIELEQMINDKESKLLERTNRAQMQSD